MKYQLIKLILFIFTVFIISGCDNSVSTVSKPNVVEQQKQSDECLQSNISNNSDSVLEPKITQVCPIG